MSTSGLNSNDILSLINSLGGGEVSPTDVQNSLAGITLPNPPSYTAFNVPQLSGGGQLDQQLVNLLSGQTVLPSSGIVGGLESLIPSITNNPYSGLLQSSALAAGAASGQQGAQDVTNANILSGLASSLAPNLQTILTQAFDPQTALYNQMLSQLTNQANVGLANSGILNTPAGQDVLGQDLSNFNINWQNQLLNRMGTGLQSYLSGLGGVGSAFNSAAGLGNTGVEALLNQGQIPYTAANTVTDNSLSQLLNLLSAQTGQLGAVSGPLNSYQNSATSRLGLGLNAANTNYQNQNQQYQNLISGLAGLLSGGNPTAPAGTTGQTPGSDIGYINMPTRNPVQPQYGTAPDPYASGGTSLSVGGDPSFQPGAFDTTLNDYIPPINYGSTDFGIGSDLYNTNQSGWANYDTNYSGY